MKILFLLMAALPLLAQEPAKPAETPAAEQKKEAAAPAEQAAPAEAPPAEKTPAETGVTGSLEVGYRAVDFRGGDFNTYRSVVNLGEGVRLLNLDGSIRSANRRLFDRIDVRGMGWGGDPYTTAFANAFKERVYDLRLDYRNMAYYNFLPSIDNPLLQTRGINLTERAYDTRIRNFDSELRFLPGTKFMPYIAFDRNTNQGTGITTFTTNGNEFPVWNDVSSDTERYRGGVQVQLEKFHATIEVGGNQYSDDQNVNWSGSTIGNREGLFLGQRLFLTGLAENYQISGDSLFTRALLSYTPASWIDLSGQFLYSRPRTDTAYSSNATGNFASPSTLQFYDTQRDFGTAYANQPHSSGSYLIDLRPMRRLRILESLSVDRFHVASTEVLSQVTPLSPDQVQNTLNDRTVVNYNRHQTEAMFDLTSFLTVRGGFRYVWGDVSSRGALTGLTPTDSAELSQSVGLGGLQLRVKQRLTINGDVEGGTTSKAYFRTSLYNYSKSSIRARYSATNSLNLYVMQSLTKNTNPTPGISLDFLYSQTSAGFQFNPKGGSRVSVIGDYTYARLRSDVIYIDLPFFEPATSNYRDFSHTITGLLDVAPSKFLRVSAGGSYFKSSGSRPTAYYQPQARISIPVGEHAQVNGEWRYYGMSQNFYTFEGFRAHTFIASLRLMR